MKKTYAAAVIGLLCVQVLFCLQLAFGREAKLVRYPHYYQGRVAFSYLGDIWTADENGQGIRRITVHKARDVYPRFSPDGRWIAFSSDRHGNLDVFVIPAAGGTARQLTFHSADDTVLGWSPDSKAVLFSSNRGEDFMPKLYLVGVEDAREKNAGADMGVWASFSPDGRRLAINRKGQVYWRKYYRGAYQTDITVMDVAAKKFTDLTDFDGLDSWPMWSTDGHIYFVSDREGGGLTNIWRIADGSAKESAKGSEPRQARNGPSAESPLAYARGSDSAPMPKPERVTSFTSGDVRWPSISADGKVIVFEHDFGIWKLDLASRKVTPIKLDINAETEENLTEVRDFNSELDDYDLSPSGRRIVFSTHGELFTAPVEEGDLRQITDSPARDKEPQYSPDGKSIAFISDRSGREEIYLIAADGSGEPQKITDLDILKLAVAWSPNSKEIAFTSSDYTLRKYSTENKQTIELSSSKYGNIGAPAWSPDSKWIAFSKPDATRNTDIYLIPAAGGEEKKVTFDSYSEHTPRFSADGRKLYFIRSEGGGGFGRGGESGVAHIYSMTLDREERDPNDPEERLESTEPSDAAGDVAQGEGRRFGAARNQPPKEVKIDWTGLKRRTRQLTRMPFGVTNYAISPDSRTIVFLTSEPAGTRTVPVVYSIREDGRSMTRVTSGTPSGGEDADTPARGFGFRAGISEFHFSRDGRALFFKEGSSVYSVSMPAASGSGPAATASMAGRRGAGGSGAQDSSGGLESGRGSEGARRRVNFVAKVKIDRPTEWAEMFDDAWRTMKYRFYDPKMHGKNWDAARQKYQPLVEHVGDRQELLNIINEMIGELNASHTGAAPGFGGRESAVSTGNLGMELESDPTAGRYRVTHVYEDGPADKDWVKVSTGNYLIAINGKPVLAGDNYWPLLNYRLNRKVEVAFNDKPQPEGAWKTRIEPVSQGAFSQLRYERWVKQRRAMVDKLSGGRIGYLHVQAMNPPSLRKFEKELRENRNKEALVIDERWNGGGNIEQELLAILVQRQYQVWQPRGTEPTGRPFAGFFGPKVVLQNWRSASNAEMFPAGFRALGLGKVIGTPTMGAVIGTGSYSLIDGSTVRTPGVGVFLADPKRTNMENYGVRPDILVENTPEDNLAGRDRQLETAVAELMKELGKNP